MSYTIHDAIKELIEVSGNERYGCPLPDDEVFAWYENELNIKIPADLRTALKEIGNIFYGYFSIIALSKSRSYYKDLLQVMQHAHAYGVDESWIPICEDNSDFYCLTPSGEVRFFSHNGYSDEKWESLARWIKEVWIDESQDDDEME